MVSVEFRFSSASRAAIVMLLPLAAPYVCMSQPALSPSPDRHQEIIDEILDEASTGGPQSAALIEPLIALALHYEDEGDRALAMAVIERARSLIRTNYGLHSSEQVPYIQQLMSHAEAIGDVETAWELEQQLLAIAGRHPDDLSMVTVFRDAAKRRVDVLERFLAGESVPQIVLGCYYDWKTQSENFSCVGGEKDDALRTLSLDARKNYADAIAVILRNELYASDDLQELEMALVQNAELMRRAGVDYVGVQLNPYAFSQRWQSAMDSLDRLTTWRREQSYGALSEEHEESEELRRKNSLTMSLSNYLTGRLSLERLFVYGEAASKSPLELVEALVRIADWDLVNSKHALALEGYALAYEMLKASEYGQSAIDRFFSPGTPVVLPTIVPNRLARSPNRGPSSSYIDVAFDITKYGSSRRVRVQGVTADATDSDRNELVRFIRSSRFRPRMVDGQTARSRVELRYELNP